MNILPGSCSGMCVSSCNDSCEEISIKAEQGTDIEINVEEVPERISFPEIKSEPDEVSYVSVCHQCTKMAGLFFGPCCLSLSTCATPVWGMEICSILGYVDF